jgi:polyisoprenoid-binding protein YceI
MNMASIKATDIDDESLDSTLKDWFNTSEYPTAEFFLNEASSTQVSGIMTINGQSREISFPATIIVEEDTVIANADFALDRTQW